MESKAPRHSTDSILGWIRIRVMAGLSDEALIRKDSLSGATATFTYRMNMGRRFTNFFPMAYSCANSRSRKTCALETETGLISPARVQRSWLAAVSGIGDSKDWQSVPMEAEFLRCCKIRWPRKVRTRAAPPAALLLDD